MVNATKDPCVDNKGSPCATTTTPCATTTTPCPTTTTPCPTTTTPCPTTTTPCATTMANPCDTTAKFMGKYALDKTNGIASVADIGPRLGGQWFLALSASILCLAGLVMFGAFRIRAMRATGSTDSLSRPGQESLMQESVPSESDLE